MPKIDLTISISVILAICAIVVPLLNTLLNNHHQFRLKKLELKSSLQKEELFYQRSIYENYLKSAMRCIQDPDTNSLHEYGESYALALIYFPSNYTQKLIEINAAISNRQGMTAISSLNELAESVRTILKKL